jgi:signal transduction histidine kinase
VTAHVKQLFVNRHTKKKASVRTFTRTEVAGLAVAQALGAGARAAAVYLAVPGGRDLELGAIADRGGRPWTRAYRLPPALPGAVEEAAHRYRVVWSAPLDVGSLLLPGAEGLEVEETLVLLPLLGRLEVFGLMVLVLPAWARPGTDDDRRAVLALAARCAHALERTPGRLPPLADSTASLEPSAAEAPAANRAPRALVRMDDGERRAVAAASRARLLEAVRGWLEPAGSALDVARVLEEQVARAMSATGAFLARWSDVTNRLTVVACPARDERSTADEMAAAFTDVTLADRPAFLESRAELSARWPGLAAKVESGGASASAVLPLVLGERRLGALGFTWTTARGFPPDERAFLQALSRAFAEALERLRLSEGEQRAREREAVLADIGGLLDSGLDEEALLRHLAPLVVQRLADLCAIEVLEPGGRTRPLVMVHVDPQKTSQAAELRRRYPPRAGRPSSLQEVLRTREPRLYRDLPSEMLQGSAPDDDHLRLLRVLDVRSALAVPLATEERTLGVLLLGRGAEAGPYREEDLGLAVEIARRAALAAERARLSREAKRALEARDEFLAAAGHELRNPLAALLVQTQSLERAIKREGADPRIHRRLQKIAGAGWRLQRLLDGLLDASSISADRLQIEPEPVALEALVGDVVAGFHDAARLAGCELSFLADGEVRGSWDGARLRQVVSSLVDNALKYGRGRPVDVRVARRGAVALVSVADQGVGIPLDQQRRVFERFAQITPRQLGGFGLGLWIARQIVEACEGGIDLSSEPGRGSTFTVSLPLGQSRRWTDRRVREEQPSVS